MHQPSRLPVLTQAVWAMLLELWEDCPDKFETLAIQCSREERPAYGSITMHFVQGRIELIDVRETLK